MRPEKKGVTMFDNRWGVLLLIGQTLTDQEVLRKVHIYNSPKVAVISGTKDLGEGAWSIMECDWAMNPHSLTPRKIVATFNSHKKDAAYKKLAGK